MSNERLFLGLDLSLTSPGFAVIRVDNRKPFLVEMSSIKTKPKDSDGVRLSKIVDEVIELKDKYEYKAIIKEKGFSRFPTETQKLYKVHGVVEYALKEFKVEEIPPSTVKKHLTGNGRASKQEVQDKVCEILDLKRSDFNNDDESDACAVILSHLIKAKLIDIKVDNKEK